MKLAIIGSRNYENFDEADQHFRTFFFTDSDEEGNRKPWVTEIISGGASGSDKIGRLLAEKYDIKYTEFPADWGKFGRAAGPIRNEQIINACGMVFCLWDSASKGTANALSLAKKAKKNTIIIYH